MISCDWKASPKTNDNIPKSWYLKERKTIKRCPKYKYKTKGMKGWRVRKKTHASSPSTSGKTHEKTCPIQTRRETRESSFYIRHQLVLFPSEISS